MRKITKEAVKAFFSGRSFNSGNTRVDISGNCVSMYLHGNCIASIQKGNIYFSDCKWQTATTKERLNGIFNYLRIPGIFQKNFTWYRDNVEIIPGSTNRIPYNI